MAALATSRNLEQIINTSAMTARNDPTGLDFALANVREAFRAEIDRSPSLTAMQVQEIQTKHEFNALKHVVSSAIYGAIAQNPDAGLAMAQNPKYAPYINGHEMKRYAADVQRQNRQMDVEMRRQVREQRKAEVEAVLNKITFSMVTDQGLRVTPEHWKAFRALEGQVDPTLPELRAAASFLDVVSRRTRDGVTDPTIKQELLNAYAQGEMKLVQLQQYFNGGHLSSRDFAYFTNLMRKPDPARKSALMEFNPVMRSFRGLLSKTEQVLGGRIDVEGEQRYGQFVSEAVRRFDTAYSEGGITAVRKMLKDTNPEWIGHLAAQYVGKKGLEAGVDELRRRMLEGSRVVPTGPGLETLPPPRPEPKPQLRPDSFGDFLRQRGL
jgi:hypothetical protein